MCNINNGSTRFISIEESENTRNWFRYETFYNLFEFKVFRHEERDTQYLTILTFPSEPQHVRHPCRKLLVWPRRAPKIDFLRPSTNLNSNSPNQREAPVAHKVAWPRPGLNLNYCFFFSQIPQILSPASRHDVIHVPGQFPIWVFLL